MSLVWRVPRGESLFSIKRTRQHSLGLQNCSRTNHKTSGEMLFGQRRPTRRCAIMHSSMFGENQKAYQQKHFIPGVKDIDRRWWLGFFGLLCKPGNLAFIECIVKSSVYQSTIQQMWGHMLDNCSLVNVTGQICNRIAEKDVQPSAWLLRDLRGAVKKTTETTP